MPKFKKWLIAITIPLLIFLTFYHFYEKKEVLPIKKMCTYVSPDTCMHKNRTEDTLKNIDLTRYNIDSSNLKVGEKVVYHVTPESTVRFRFILGAFIICFLLIFFIRYPILWHLFIIGF